MGLAHSADQALIVVYACAVAHHRAACRLLDAGVLVRGQKGELVKSPAAQLVRDNAVIIARVGEQLGLSPGSRSRLSVSTETIDETTNRWLT